MRTPTPARWPPTHCSPGAIVNVFIDRDQQDLPRQRVELLDSAISVLAAVWRERLSGTYRQETEDDILAALPAVAAYIHDTEPTGVIAAPEFERELLGELRLIRGRLTTGPIRPCGGRSGR